MGEYWYREVRNWFREVTKREEPYKVVNGVRYREVK